MTHSCTEIVKIIGEGLKKVRNEEFRSSKKGKSKEKLVLFQERLRSGKCFIFVDETLKF